MTDANPLVSVIVPVYNPGKYLYHCLDSITGQTYQNLEIILIDDGSTDNSLQVCREYAEKDSRIKVFSQENAGVSAARNKGIEESNGELLSFIDSDDYLEQNTYESLIEVFLREKPDIVCYEYFSTFSDHEKIHTVSDKSWYGMKDRRTAMRQQATGNPFLWTKLFARRVVEEIRFTVGLARGEDGEYCIYAIHRADKIFYLDRPFVHYVQSEESAVRGKFRPSQLSYLDACPRSFAFFQTHYPELAINVQKSYLHHSVMFYYDMYADEEDYTEEMKRTYDRFKEMYSKIEKKKLTGKEKIKFSFFSVSPGVFCFFHKLHL